MSNLNLLFFFFILPLLGYTDP